MGTRSLPAETRSDVKVVAGLGNPGREYEGTAHNVGFDVADLLAGRFDGRFRRKLWIRAQVARVEMGPEPVLLVKPQTFMNLSGEAVESVMRKNGASPADLVVVVDDADLELGRIRVRAKGGSGGHRGLQSIVDRIGSQDFPRIRVGIGRRDGVSLTDQVLSRLSREERERMLPAIEKAADAVECVVSSGVDAAMNKFNAAVRGSNEENGA